MSFLLSLSRGIDALNERVGRTIFWLVLAAVLVSTINAIIRKVFNYSSNAFLETQWYMFSAVFLLCSGYTLLRNEHVRIDVIAGRFSHKTQAWIDVIGTLFFLLPMALMFIWLSWPWFLRAYTMHEMSSNAGGLLIWPARILVPIGFTLLTLQALSELIKRLAFIAGRSEDPFAKPHEPTPEEILAEEIRKQREAQA